MISGAGVTVGGLGGGAVIAATSGIQIYSALTTATIIAGGSVIFACGTGIMTIGLGVYAGYKLFNKGMEMTKEPETRENLVIIIMILANAINQYDRHKETKDDF
jgi:hypothetical protein